MKSPFSIAVWAVLASVIVKMLVFVTGNQFSDIGRYAIFVNIFIIMIAVFWGIREHKKNVGNQSTYLEDVKEGMKTASWFAIILSVFVYCYYNYIDTKYFAIRLQENLELAESQNMDVEKARETGEIVLSPFFHTTMTLIGFILMGAFYSTLIAFFMRKMKGFGH